MEARLGHFSIFVMRINKRTQKHVRHRHENTIEIPRFWRFFPSPSCKTTKKHERNERRCAVKTRSELRLQDEASPLAPCPATTYHEESPDASPAPRLRYILLVFFVVRALRPKTKPQVKPKASKKIIPTRIICTNCGKDNSPEAKYCSQCGFALPKA